VDHEVDLGLMAPNRLKRVVSGPWPSECRTSEFVPTRTCFDAKLSDRRGQHDCCSLIEMPLRVDPYRKLIGVGR
jgi:hypothetical protein